MRGISILIQLIESQLSKFYAWFSSMQFGGPLGIFPGTFSLGRSFGSSQLTAMKPIWIVLTQMLMLVQKLYSTLCSLKTTYD